MSLGIGLFLRAHWTRRYNYWGMAPCGPLYSPNSYPDVSKASGGLGARDPTVAFDNQTVRGPHLESISKDSRDKAPPPGPTIQEWRAMGMPAKLLRE